MGQSAARLVLWAAQEGRSDDLVFHLGEAGVQALGPVPNTEKNHAPIHGAAIGGHLQCIRILWEAGSNLNLADKDGHTPLHLAAVNYRTRAVELLLQLGANPFAVTRFGVTPLHLAASVNNGESIELMAQWGGNLDAQESWGQTALAIATLKSRLHSMKTLIGLGASTEVADYHHKQTPLHIACGRMDEECVLLLLDASANVHAVNDSGQSALGVALTNKFYRAVPLLLEYGAKLNAMDRCFIPEQLQKYIDEKTDRPLTSLQLCRVSVRRSLGPSGLKDIEQCQLPEDVVKYVLDILSVCDEGREVKKAVIQAAAAVQQMQGPSHGEKTTKV